MRHQVRIVSDGDSTSTVVTTDKGEQLYPKSATLYMEAGEVNRVDVEFFAPLHDVHADLQEVTFVCRCCLGQVVHNCNGDR